MNYEKRRRLQPENFYPQFQMQAPQQPGFMPMPYFQPSYGYGPDQPPFYGGQSAFSGGKAGLEAIYGNPLQPEEMSGRPPIPFHPYPAPGTGGRPPVKGSMSSLLNSFKNKDGTYDMTKMVDTAGMMVNTVSQVTNMVKGLTGMFKV